MRRFTPDEWAGLAMLAVCVGIGAPVVLGSLDPLVPLAVWILLYAAAIAAILLTTSTVDRPRVQYGCYTAAVVLGWCVVLTFPWAEMLAVLLVVIAAIGCYVVTLRINLVVIALNSAVLVLAWTLTEREPIDLLFIVGFYTMIQIAALFSMVALVREQRMRAELTEAHVELQAAGVLLEDTTRTAERLRISRELHDLIGHQLTVLTLELETARHREDAAAREHVEQANQVARDLLANVRSTVSTLRAEPSPGLAASLRTVGRDIPGLDIDVEVADGVQVDEEQTAALVRATQEVITNTLKHAEARELWIDVARNGETVRLTAVDNGTGASGLVPGNGLSGLTERFVALGGGVEFDGSAGFRVTAWVPAR